MVELAGAEPANSRPSHGDSVQLDPDHLELARSMLLSPGAKDSAAKHYLKAFACELTSSWPPARVLGWFRAAVRGQDPGDPGDLGMGSICYKNINFYPKKQNNSVIQSFRLPPGALGGPGERPGFHGAPSGPHEVPMGDPWEPHGEREREREREPL